jgi:hypothetical protein
MPDYDYSKLTEEEFDKILTGVVECMSVNQIMNIPGVYEILREECNNEVLSIWEEEHERDS